MQLVCQNPLESPSRPQETFHSSTCRTIDRFPTQEAPLPSLQQGVIPPPSNLPHLLPAPTDALDLAVIATRSSHSRILDVVLSSVECEEVTPALLQGGARLLPLVRQRDMVVTGTAQDSSWYLGYKA